MQLTKPQKQIWDMECFAGGAISVICTSLMRQGNAEESLLQEAANKLFLFNDALRTKIQMTDSEITQIVMPYNNQVFPVLQFSNAEEMDSYAEQYAQRALDIRGALCEISIVVMPDSYGLLVKIHHIIADAWTMALLATQFNMLMEGEIPPHASYQDYCSKQLASVNSKKELRDRRYFLDAVRTMGEPVYISNRQTKGHLARRLVRTIPGEDVERITAFATQCNCSVFSVFATALACYISRINNNAEKLCIGTTVLNRTSDSEMYTAGMFVNTVPVFMNVDADMAFQESLEWTEDALLSVFRHQRCNYVELLRQTQEEPLTEGRLFDVILNYMNASIAGTQQKTESKWYHNGIQNESLQIHIDDRQKSGILRITYDYQIAKFTDEDIEQLHNHLLNLLYAGINCPNTHCHALRMLSAAEEQKLRYEYNDTSVKYPINANATVFSLFEENAKKHAEDICMHVCGKNVKYSEMLFYSQVVDAAIREKIRAPKSVIAVIAERSAQMYYAIYGIIRGGNAYLPISPEDPKERIQYILENSGAAAVIVQEQFADLVEDATCINISQLMSAPHEQMPPIASSATPEDTAYIIYTSGSTGNPKGVKISHRSVINRILWMDGAYPLGSDGVILQKTVYTFDVSVWEIFWWGMCGGKMAVSKPGEHAIPARILEEVVMNKVTHLHFVPSVFNLFLRYLEKNRQETYKFASVKHVFLSGEVLEPEMVSRFHQLFDYPAKQLHNLYGPTECTVDVTYYDCTPADEIIPIGSPISNTQAYIVDQYLNLLPEEAMGELVVGGINVGQGYVNNQPLSQKCFVQNPFASGLLYKTGDLAYRRKDGEIIFCGRMDSQMKINGQRVELGEIEATIRSVPAVTAVTVDIYEHNDQKKLVAYYCSEEPVDELIDKACNHKLPHYMIPEWVRVDHIPLLPNGKLDRRAVEKVRGMVAINKTCEPPVDSQEKYICEIFQRVLQQPNVGRNSDFFALGGTSLSVISFLAESGFDDITPALFIQNATPAKLASLRRNRPLCNQYIQTIHQSTTGKKAYVLFPFAGGGAESYSHLVYSVKQINTDISVFFVPFLHNEVECEKAAEEIALLAPKYELYFYSHCVGSAVAMQIIQYLEGKHGIAIKQYIAAASVPLRAAWGINLWNYVPNRALARILRKAGASEFTIPKEQQERILKHFRADTDFAARFFACEPRKIQCPVFVLLAKGDLFTKYSRRIELRWKQYANNLAQVRWVDVDTHYFHAECSDLVAQEMIHTAQCSKADNERL